MAPYHPKKRLGQHFLKSEKIISRIIELVAPAPTDTIIEIGPGRGILTLPLAKSGASVVAIEFDRDVIGYLQKLLASYPKVRLINTDFLSFQPEEEDITSCKLVGNLPYNITSPVLEWVTRYHDMIHHAVFMMQKEVAMRISATPGSKNWSPISIFMQLGFTVEICFDVAPEHFQPPPKVMSAVVSLQPKKVRAISNKALFEKIVRTAFRQRRKQLVSNLAPALVPDKETARNIISQAKLNEQVRAEQLSTEDFLRLTEILATYTIP